MTKKEKTVTEVTTSADNQENQPTGPQPVLTLVTQLLTDGTCKTFHMEQEEKGLPNQALYISLLGMAHRTIEVLNEAFNPNYGRESLKILQTLLHASKNEEPTDGSITESNP
tara:strand:+ start:7458 stop:7793 length:336 start_codon:yes stop_codon:yes gene_type:complete